MSTQIGQLRRRGVVLAALVLGGLLAVAAFAYACTNVATISLDRKVARSGSVLTGTGKGFRSPARGGGPVEIHFNSIDGNKVTEATPDPASVSHYRCCDIKFSFEVPKAKPGRYTIVATQDNMNTPEKDHTYGTPARTVLRVK